MELIIEKNKYEKIDGGLTLLYIVGIYGGKSLFRVGFRLLFMILEKRM